MTERRPLIGLSASWDTERKGYRIYANYCELVKRGGGEPVILPFCYDGAARLDGLVLTGGDDVAPEIGGYGPSPLVTLDEPERDEMELKVFREAFDAGVPVLGICRGHQLINCALGGGLIRDIHEAGYAEEHMRGEKLGPHPMKTVPGLLYNKLVGDELEVWSTHHQAVDPKRLGRGITVNAWSPEGIVEGIEHENCRVLGVQTHPERMMLMPVIEWLVRLARERMS